MATTVLQMIPRAPIWPCSSIKCVRDQLKPCSKDALSQASTGFSYTAFVCPSRSRRKGIKSSMLARWNTVASRLNTPFISAYRPYGRPKRMMRRKFFMESGKGIRKVYRWSEKGDTTKGTKNTKESPAAVSHSSCTSCS